MNLRQTSRRFFTTKNDRKNENFSVGVTQDQFVLATIGVPAATEETVVNPQIYKQIPDTLLTLNRSACVCVCLWDNKA